MLFDQEANQLQAGFSRLNGLKFTGVENGLAHFETAFGTLEVSAPGKDLLRLRCLRAPAPDYGILVDSESLDQAAAEAGLQVQAEGEQFRVSAGDLELVLQQEPLRLAVYRAGRLMLESATDRTIGGVLRLHPLAADEERWLLSLALPSEEPVFGLGEKFGGLNKRGQRIENWNRDATGVNAEISYKNVPFAWSPRGWGVFVHTTARVTHGVGYSPWSHRSYALKLDDPNLDLFLLFADSPAEMLRQYTALTGRTALPPTWTYGAWFSRAIYKTADEIMDVARQLRARRIPADVLTLDGRAWHKPETRYDFSWDPERYPDPAGFVRGLRQMNYRLCLWEYSYLSDLNPIFGELAAKGYFLKDKNGETYIYRWLPPPNDRLIPHLQPSGLIDFTHPEAYAWFRDMHRALFEIGVSVMKTDYGEALPEDVVGHNGDTGKRLHNAYTLLYNRCVYEASQMYGEKEGVVWGRSSWAGGQRYPVQWGGDPQGDWEGLAGSIRGGLSWGMSGGAFYTHDIGGFYGPQESGGLLGTGMPDPELYIRWAEAAVMTSHTRFHGTSPREPWFFGEQAEQIIRQWLAWRYQLIPYLQACALEASQSGLPVMRAMPLAFPNEPLAWGFEHQYMLGPSLLVAPVIQPGGKVRFYLPAGRWFDIWEQKWEQGPGLFERQMPLHQIPVFGREGNLLPLGPAVQHTGELKAGLHLEQVWAFGQPKSGMTLPGLVLNRLEDVPEGVTVVSYQ
ncbi:MAG: alpha-xylosidase [Anaerolineales bacterium]